MMKPFTLFDLPFLARKVIYTGPGYQDGEASGLISLGGLATAGNTQGQADLDLLLAGSAGLGGELVAAATGAIRLAGSADLRLRAWEGVGISWYYSAWAHTNTALLIAAGVANPPGFRFSLNGGANWTGSNLPGGGSLMNWTHAAGPDDGSHFLLAAEAGGGDKGLWRIGTAPASITKLSVWGFHRVYCSSNGQVIWGNRDSSPTIVYSLDAGASFLGAHANYYLGAVWDMALSGDGTVAFAARYDGSGSGQILVAAGSPSGVPTVTAIPFPSGATYMAGLRGMGTDTDGTRLYVPARVYFPATGHRYGVFRSEDGGATFDWLDLESAGGNAHFVFAASGATLVRFYRETTVGSYPPHVCHLSIDGGDTWQLIQPTLPGVASASISRNEKRLLALATNQLFTLEL